MNACSQNQHFKLRRMRQHIKQGAELVFTFQTPQETMVLEVIIRIARQDVDDHATKHSLRYLLCSKHQLLKVIKPGGAGKLGWMIVDWPARSVPHNQTDNDPCHPVSARQRAHTPFAIEYHLL